MEPIQEPDANSSSISNVSVVRMSGFWMFTVDFNTYLVSKLAQTIKDVDINDPELRLNI
jgi:hypothetical protein